MPTSLPPSAAINSKLPLFRIYQKTRHRSIKHDSYFQVYEEVFARYRDQAVTFVEVGVLSGGSLFMWRDYFGPRARIIGIDLNPVAKKWSAEGFEIFIGDQADPEFWRSFYRDVGLIDILLDDGGHSNRQQLITLHHAIGQVRDGGVVMIEDVHASYLRAYGNPSRYSFISFAKRMVDSLNSRHPAVKTVKNDYGHRVFSISFYESIAVFHVDSRRCFPSSFAPNQGASDEAVHRRRTNSPVDFILGVRRLIFRRLPFIKNQPMIKNAVRRVLGIFQCILFKIDNWKLRKFFR